MSSYHACITFLPAPKDIHIRSANKKLRFSTESEERTSKEGDTNPEPANKLTSTNLAKQNKMGLSEMYAELMKSGYLIEKDGKYELTPLGISIGGESKPNRYKKGEFYFLWPSDISL
ncbi:hypothetical protein QIG84_25500 [Klebsiella pneumoniae]|uniref:hypothetical protein n=1 Tax=Klebsiella pneumoniae TaxID=573 RepID=UPI00042EF583|nr:hypothetical protein [Klebsiella pneumoniae]MCD9704226.1 hypothetical protein [Klebsiella pneumoniae]MDH8457819.1 hypothetical protein [Klebsiella pneumoniae]MDM7342773.1 hypothetical protein [Klebsiella pneumoniae]MDM7437009.1 hypothetical protein [Klebsiella pneumoniae]MDM7508516.1 hypothetical protein [Klebsiella pneumoniae]